MTLSGGDACLPACRFIAPIRSNLCHQRQGEFRRSMEDWAGFVTDVEQVRTPALLAAGLGCFGKS